MEGVALRQSSRHNVLMPVARGNQGDDDAWLRCWREKGQGREGGCVLAVGGLKSLTSPAAASVVTCQVLWSHVTCCTHEDHAWSSGRKLSATNAATALVLLQG